MRVDTIPALIQQQSVRFGDQQAVIDGDACLTYRELETEMLKVARALATLGCGKGDCIAIWAPNSARWLSAYLGGLACGAAVVPLNTRLKGAEAAFQLRRTRTKVLFTVGEFLGNDYLRMLHTADPSLAEVTTIMLDDTPRTGCHEWDAFLSATDIDTAAQRLPSITCDDTAYVLFTSGTTGQPKGAMLTHGNNLRFAEQMMERFALSDDERIYLVLPLFHTFGLNGGFLMGIAAGAAIVLESVFDAETVMQYIERERITFLPGPPTVFSDILQSPQRREFDLSSLRKALLSATSIPAALVRQLIDEGIVDSAFSAYGLTEALAVSCSCPGDPPEVVAEWSGRVLPAVEARIVDNDGAPAGAGQPGEILVRSPMVMAGYFNDAIATEAAFAGDRWLRTGDIGVMNERGYIKITDRKKDMFTVGGFNVYPAEVEAILADHPVIVSAAVISMPDERLGEVGAAFVVLCDAEELTATEIISWSRQNMANYKVPRVVRIVDELPTSASLKVRKDVLRIWLAETDELAVPGRGA